MGDAVTPHYPLSPGPEGTPVPPGTRVIRMANEPAFDALSPEFQRRVRDGKALPSFFRLSSEDEKEPVPRLSVWVEGVTTVEQAWVLVGAHPKRTWVLFLDTDRVTTVQAGQVPGFPATIPLQIQWEPAKARAPTGVWVLETRPGAAGHAGVAHLNQGNKTQREALRSILADLATVRVLTPEEIAEFASPPPPT